MKEIALLEHRSSVPRRLLGIMALVVLYGAITAGLYGVISSRTANRGPVVQVVAGVSPPTRAIVLRDGRFWVDGQPVMIESVGWDPVRPGELPWTRAFHPDELNADLSRIAAAGFNTVRTWAPLGSEELALVAQHHLWVLQGIWVPPDGRFEDPRFRRDVLSGVRRAVEASRWSPAVLGYLVMNEPRARAVASSGLEATRSLLREVVATVRALDPGAPIGYASWPGMEALDDSLLDFTAFNLYPHRPRVVMDELGMRGYVSMLRREVAHGRPLLISEFGVSVSPGRPLRTPGRGGATESEQAAQLCALESDFLAEGVAGTSVFQWSDGWWKNHEHPGDESTHDPMDPEEWFGLVRFESLGDRLGTPRPALAALQRYQELLLVEPTDGAAVAGEVPVSLYGAAPARVRVAVDGGPFADVPVHAGPMPSWQRGTLRLPPGRHDLVFELTTASARREETRAVSAGGEAADPIHVRAARPRVTPRSALDVTIDGARAGEDLVVTAYAEDRAEEERLVVRADAHGRAAAGFRAPDHPSIVSIVSFPASAAPGAVRPAAIAEVECRRAVP